MSEVYNMQHPDFAGKTEEAFEAEGIKYYCFKQDSDMRYSRYIFLQDFLQEVNLRIDLDSLKQYIGITTANLDGSKGQINLGKALETLSIMKQRASLAFEPDTIFRLASCIYFDDTEVLNVWDKAHNDAKVKVWKDKGITDFFFHKLFQELTGLKDISKTVLEDYLKAAPKAVRGWDSIIKDILSQ